MNDDTNRLKNEFERARLADNNDSMTNAENSRTSIVMTNNVA